jgi:hypothetical protein
MWKNFMSSEDAIGMARSFVCVCRKYVKYYKDVHKLTLGEGGLTHSWSTRVNNLTMNDWLNDQSISLTKQWRQIFTDN